MLSYIHAYHAGNHADILKHITISLILSYLSKKEKPFSVIDTHAGSGLYNLEDERAKKTEEASGGIIPLITRLNENSFSPENLNLGDPYANGFEKYLSLVSEYYLQKKYPGSPFIENAFLRKDDVQVLSELHPTAFDELKENFRSAKVAEAQLHKRNGYELFSAVTPPKIKRGLAVIDPSFEDKSDFKKCGEVISEVHKKWRNGIIVLWYPLIDHRSAEISMMKEHISRSVDSTEPKILDVQLEVRKKEEMTGLSSLYGSGMFIVNFPYKLDEALKTIMPYLSNILGQTSKNWTVDVVE